MVGGWRKAGVEDAVTQIKAAVFGIANLMATGGDGVAVDFSFGKGTHRGK